MPFVSRVGDFALNPADVHGKPCCPHPVSGPGISGSPDVLIENSAPLRIGDPGVHMACCGPNVWVCATGSGTVYVNNIGVSRVGDITAHCGGVGALIHGAGTVDCG